MVKRKFKMNNLLFLFLTFFLSSSISLKAQKDEKTIRWRSALKQDESWYKSEEAIRIADNVLAYQNATGGWQKNIDMARMLDQNELKKLKAKNRKVTSTTFDNSATSTQMYYLAKVYGQTELKRFKESFQKGLDYIFEAQYDNGGWPQFYPVKKGYSSHITYNDNAMVNVMKLLQDIVKEDKVFVPLQLSDENKIKSRNAFDKGIQCILKTQIYIDGKPTVWCAQHDEKTLAPAIARSYELESFSGSESVGITLLLMSIENPSKEIIAAVLGAVLWFENNKIEGVIIKSEKNDEGKNDRILVEDKDAPAMWGRFYDLETSKPYFCSRDGIKKNTIAEISHERRNGYSWYTYAPQSVLDKLPEWRKTITIN